METKDLIKRNLAIAYATSGLVRRIDGEEWIRTSDVKQSLNDVPTVEPCLDCGNYDKANYYCPRFCEVIREATKEIKRQGEWIYTPNIQGLSEYEGITCSVCGDDSIGDFNYCPNCGADMRGNKNG